MAYTPTEWKAGDVVTSTKLNKIENGIKDASSGGGGGGATVTLVEMTVERVEEEDIMTLNIKAKELWDALKSGVVCVYSDDEATRSSIIFMFAQATYDEEGGYRFTDSSYSMNFTADGDDDYPVSEGQK